MLTGTIHKKNSGRSGFTLVEMAILTMISGLFMVGALQFWNNKQTVKRYRNTTDRMALAQTVVDEYFFRFGRYPCPADPRLPPTDVRYGRSSNYDPLTDTYVGNCRANIAAVCAPGWPLNEPKCVSMGARDADAVPGPDRVLIGGVPFVTLSEPSLGLATPYAVAQGFDGYGNILSYAVTESMTDQVYSYSNPVKPRLGAIEVRDSNNRSVITPAGSAHYVVFSHGETAEGAFTREGTRVTNCFVSGFATVPPGGFNPGTPGMQVELENCDNNDAIFVKELRSFADTDDFNDDILYYGVNMQDQIWRNSTFAPINDQYYYNTNIGFIGAGTTNPAAPLHVAGATGTMRVETHTESDLGYCDVNGDDCLQPAFIAGSGDTCADHEIATGIENNQLVCEPLIDSGASLNWVGGNTCPAGEVVTGVEVRAGNNLQLVCSPDPSAP